MPPTLEYLSFGVQSVDGVRRRDDDPSSDDSKVGSVLANSVFLCIGQQEYVMCGKILIFSNKTYQFT